MNKAVCLITINPNKIFLDFFTKFSNYDIYIVIDNNEDYSELISCYPSITFVQLNNEDCLSNGFSNLNYIIFNKNVTGLEKSLYYFAHIKQTYEYIWFMEDDVYFYDENTLLTIDKKYENADLLCNSSFVEAKLDEWLWDKIQINLKPPYYCGMMCIIRFSQKMLESIKDYATKNNTLFFLEACYPTIAVKYDLIYIKNPDEFLNVTYCDIHSIDLLNKHSLYHPMKNIETHVEARNKE